MNVLEIQNGERECFENIQDEQCKKKTNSKCQKVSFKMLGETSEMRENPKH